MSKYFVGYCVSGQLANGGKTGTYAIVLQILKTPG